MASGRLFIRKRRFWFRLSGANHSRSPFLYPFFCFLSEVDQVGAHRALGGGSPQDRALGHGQGGAHRALGGGFLQDSALGHGQGGAFPHKRAQGHGHHLGSAPVENQMNNISIRG